LKGVVSVVARRRNSVSEAFERRAQCSLQQGHNKTKEEEIASQGLYNPWGHEAKKAKQHSQRLAFRDFQRISCCD